jgi:ABC-type branched-subunit amino acid transport system substrate-binding protein
MKKLLLASSLVFVVCLIFGSSAVSVSSSQEILKIGSLVHLQSPEGVEIQKWMKLFAKNYNDRGGWNIGGVRYRVEPLMYDCGMRDVNKSRAGAERAALKDGVKYLICDWMDIPSAVSTITEPNKVLYLALDFTESTVNPKLNYTFRTLGLYFTRYLAYRIAKDYKAKGAKTVVIVNPDNEKGIAGERMFAASDKAAGLEVVGTVRHPMDTVDYSPIATKIVSFRPDFVDFAMCSGNEISLMIAALKDAGFKGFVFPGGAFSPTILENTVKKVGKEYLEGWETTCFDPWGIQKDPKMVALMDAYVKEYGTWRSEGCFYVISWFMFEDAVNTTQSTDVEVLRKYLQNSKKGIMTLTGYNQLFARPEIGNYKTIDAAPSHFLGVIKDGKIVSADTLPVKDQYLSSIMTYGLVDVYQKYWNQYGYPAFPPEKSEFDFDKLRR